MQLTFHGAARQVTGSCHLVETNESRVLVDCGLFQGGRDSWKENKKPFPFDAAGIDYVLLTHTHLDHCGRIPQLIDRGFRGSIITTPATRELARIVLMDAARIQEEDARRRSRHTRDGQPSAQPLYDTEDALIALDHFDQTVHYGETVELEPNMNATYHDAGHILGSAHITLDIEEDGERRRILFSGDLGNEGKPIVRDPAPPPDAVDAVVMESTYGNRNHRSIEDSVQELYQVIREAFDAGGNVLIPSFAIERSQELLYFIREGIDQDVLPHDMEVYLDSPMAISATKVFGRHKECYDERTRSLFDNHTDPFSFPGLHLTRDPRDSMQLNDRDSGAVIIAGSGMCEGGRILHHIQHHASDPDTRIVFVGFAPRGTRAREIIDGASHTTVMGQRVKLNADVHTINGFSAHAGRDELLEWWRQADAAETVLVHGEEDVMEALANQMENEGKSPRMPEQGQGLSL